jgi:hypothetical protein
MKFFECPKCGADYSFSPGAVDELAAANEVPRCEADRETLKELTMQELDAKHANRLQEESAKRKVVDSVRTASKVRLLSEDGKTFCEVDGQKLRVTGYVIIETEAGSVRFRP